MSLAQVGPRLLDLQGNVATGSLVYISNQSGDASLWELRNGRCLQASPLYDPFHSSSLHSKGNYTCCTFLFVAEIRMELGQATTRSFHQYPALECIQMVFSNKIPGLYLSRT